MRPPKSFVGQPVRSLQTMLRVIGERYANLPVVIPDGIYGPQTMTAVSAFQRQQGIPVTGVVDQATWSAIAAEYRPALVSQGQAQTIQAILQPGQIISQGESNRCLYLAQAMLMVLSRDYPNLSCSSVTGTLDPETCESIRMLQKLCGLPVTGKLDKMTWKHLSLQYSLTCACAVCPRKKAQ